LALVVSCGLSGAAQADEKADQAFAAGQFVGAVTFCGVPRDDVNALAKAMLDAFGVDSSGPNPAMTKFKEGVTAGVTEQKNTPEATCDEVKQGFAQMKDKMQ
jgi:hypothetical protein